MNGGVYTVQTRLTCNIGITGTGYAACCFIFAPISWTNRPRCTPCGSIGYAGVSNASAYLMGQNTVVQHTWNDLQYNRTCL